MAAPKPTLVFSSAFSTILQGVIGTEIERVDRIFRLNPLPACEYEALWDVHSAFPCSKDGVVSCLDDERTYCMKHYQAVSQ